MQLILCPVAWLENNCYLQKFEVNTRCCDEMGPPDGELFPYNTDKGHEECNDLIFVDW